MSKYTLRLGAFLLGALLTLPLSAQALTLTRNLGYLSNDSEDGAVSGYGQVGRLQQWLGAHGYMATPTGTGLGNYGRATVNGVKAFQDAQNVVPSQDENAGYGQVGPATRAALQVADEVSVAPAAPADSNVAALGALSANSQVAQIAAPTLAEMKPLFPAPDSTVLSIVPVTFFVRPLNIDWANLSGSSYCQLRYGTNSTSLAQTISMPCATAKNVDSNLAFRTPGLLAPGKYFWSLDASDKNGKKYTTNPQGFTVSEAGPGMTLLQLRNVGPNEQWEVFYRIASSPIPENATVKSYVLVDGNSVTPTPSDIANGSAVGKVTFDVAPLKLANGDHNLVVKLYYGTQAVAKASATLTKAPSGLVRIPPIQTPVVSLLAPEAGAPGTTVIVHGQNLLAGQTVSMVNRLDPTGDAGVATAKVTLEDHPEKGSEYRYQFTVPATVSFGGCFGCTPGVRSQATSLGDYQVTVVGMSGASQPKTFTVTNPQVTTATADSLRSTSAVLNGSYAGFKNAVPYIRYGKTVLLDKVVTDVGTTGTARKNGTISVKVANLEPETSYYYQVFAGETSGGGAVKGELRQFTTAKIPLLEAVAPIDGVSLFSPSAIKFVVKPSAQLAPSLTGYSYCKLHYGKTEAADTSVVSTLCASAKSSDGMLRFLSDSPVTAGRYYWYLEASDDAANSYKTDVQKFSVSVSGQQQSIVTKDATLLAPASVEVAADYANVGIDNRIAFAYGTDGEVFPKSTREVKVSGSGSYSTVISGLAPDTTYYYTAQLCCGQTLLDKPTYTGGVRKFHTAPTSPKGTRFTPASVNASSAANAYPANNAIDTNPDSIWVANLTPESKNNAAWIEIDLGSVKNVTKLHWRAATGSPYPASGPTEFAVVASPDGNGASYKFITVTDGYDAELNRTISKNTPPVPNGDIDFLPNTNVRFIRLQTSQVNDGTGWSLGLKDFWVEGMPGAPVPMLSAPIRDGSSVKLTWTGVPAPKSGDMNYWVLRTAGATITVPVGAATFNPPWCSASLEKTLCKVYDGANLTTTDANTGGRQYTYAVVAANTDRNETTLYGYTVSAPATIAAVMTVADVAPRNVVATKSGYGLSAITITWDGVAGQSYDIFRSNVSGSKYADKTTNNPAKWCSETRNVDCYVGSSNNTSILYGGKFYISNGIANPNATYYYRVMPAMAGGNAYQAEAGYNVPTVVTPSQLVVSPLSGIVGDKIALYGAGIAAGDTVYLEPKTIRQDTIAALQNQICMLTSNDGACPSNPTPSYVAGTIMKESDGRLYWTIPAHMGGDINTNVVCVTAPCPSWKPIGNGVPVVSGDYALSVSRKGNFTERVSFTIADLLTVSEKPTVGFWRFGDDVPPASSAAAVSADKYDSSGNGNTLSFQNGASVTSKHLVLSEASPNQYAQVLRPSAQPTGDMTFTAWVKPTNGYGSDGKSLVSMTRIDGHPGPYDIYVNKNGRMVFRHGGTKIGQNDATIAISEFKVPLNKWSFVSVTLFGADRPECSRSTSAGQQAPVVFTMRDVSGVVSEASRTSINCQVLGEDFSRAQPLLIGIRNPENGSPRTPFVGELDNIRIYSGKLDGDAIKQIYDSEKGDFGESQTGQPPVMGVGVAPASPLATGQEYDFTWNATSPSGRPLRWQISWGDGEFVNLVNEVCHVGNTNEECPSTMFSAAHAWKAAGQYTVQASTTDRVLWSQPSRQTVTVRNGASTQPIAAPTLKVSNGTSVENVRAAGIKWIKPTVSAGAPNKIEIFASRSPMVVTGDRPYCGSGLSGDVMGGIVNYDRTALECTVQIAVIGDNAIEHPRSEKIGLTSEQKLYYSIRIVYTNGTSLWSDPIGVDGKPLVASFAATVGTVESISVVSGSSTTIIIPFSLDGTVRDYTNLAYHIYRSEYEARASRPSSEGLLRDGARAVGTSVAINAKMQNGTALSPGTYWIRWDAVREGVPQGDKYGSFWYWLHKNYPVVSSAGGPAVTKLVVTAVGQPTDVVTFSAPFNGGNPIPTLTQGVPVVIQFNRPAELAGKGLIVRDESGVNNLCNSAQELAQNKCTWTPSALGDARLTLYNYSVSPAQKVGTTGLFRVVPPPTPTRAPTVLSPNGGENLKIGSSVTLRFQTYSPWSYSFALVSATDPSKSFSLFNWNNPSEPAGIQEVPSWSAGYYGAFRDQQVVPGTYVIKVCATVNSNGGQDGTLCDVSDAPFTLSSNVVTPPTLRGVSVSSSASGDLAVGATRTYTANLDIANGTLDDANCTWSSSDEDVAHLTRAGDGPFVITANGVAAGTAQVTADCLVSGGGTAKGTVSVVVAKTEPQGPERIGFWASPTIKQTIPFGPELTLSKSFTAVAWVKSAGTPQFSGIMRNFSGDTGFSISANNYGANNARVDLNTGSSPRFATAGTRSIIDNAWHQVAFTYDNDSMRLYVDGTQDGAAVFGADKYKPSTAGLLFGDAPCAGCANRVFAGVIKNAALYDGALTKEAVKALYDADRPAIVADADTIDQLASVVAALQAIVQGLMAR